MTFETESVLDRRSLRRRLSWWRALAIIVGLGALGLLTFQASESAGLTGSRHIARVSIEGLITENRDQLRMFKKLADDKSVAAVILFINSPGGTTAGGEALFEAIRNVAKVKPVAAQFGTVAASAAYMAGIASDQIIARGNTITGSIGVIFQLPDVSQLMDKLGVRVNEVRSGPLKANPSPFQPMDEAGKAIAEQMVSETQRWFLGLVASRRGIDTASVKGLEQGRVFSGREALTHKLVDQIGAEAEVVAWLEQQRNVPKNLRIVDWKPSRESAWSPGRLSLEALGWLFGVQIKDTLSEVLGDGAMLGRLRLDGLVSVWQASER